MHQADFPQISRIFHADFMQKSKPIRSGILVES